MDSAGGKYNEQGHYATLHYTGCETRERAEEIKKALHRSAYNMFRRNVMPVTVSSKIIKDGRTWTVEFFAINKDHSYRYMLDHYGSDTSKWPYYAGRFLGGN